jgi:hypothetical protein
MKVILHNISRFISSFSFLIVIEEVSQSLYILDALLLSSGTGVLPLTLVEEYWVFLSITDIARG